MFDLDGTLSDSAEGIVAAMRLAFADLGLEPLSQALERRLVGPPWRSLLPAVIGEQATEKVIEAYRGYYAGGLMYRTRLYPGIVETLNAVRRQGATVAVATSKPEAFAVPIVERLGIADQFETVCGDGLAGERGTKADVIAEVLRRLDYPDPGEVHMVGDRVHDVVGAAEHGIGCIGAGWGYGEPGELERAGAQRVFANPGELTAALAEWDS